VKDGLRDTATIARHELRVMRSDPFPVIVLIAMPLAVMVFITPAYDQAIAHLSRHRFSGAVQSVPGMSVTFALFTVAFVGFALFREHGWGTWQRFRASPVHPLALMVGKAVAPLSIILVQHAVLFGVGIAFLGLELHGAAFAGPLVAVALGLCLVALGMALSAFATTVQQVNSVATLGAMICAGLGGALTPPSTLPAWAQLLAPLTPSYWALRGYRAAIFGSHGSSEALLATAVLIGLALLFTLLFLLRFRLEEKKVSWA
jgi:ABC-2 type transport system permease protein